MNDPGLPAYFGCDPSQFVCCKCSEDCENENPQQPSTIEESSTPATPGCKQSQDDKKHPQRDHQSEARRRHSDRRTVFRTNSIQSDDVGGSVAVQQETQTTRHEEQISRTRVEVLFERRQLRRLMLCDHSSIEVSRNESCNTGDGGEQQSATERAAGKSFVFGPKHKVGGNLHDSEQDH